MTENGFPFATADEPESGSGQDKRKLALVAGAGTLAVALLGYFVVVPMLSGSASEATTATVVHHHHVVAKTTAKKSSAKAAAAVQPATFADVSARKDPFEPLVVALPPTTTTNVAPPAAGSGSSTGSSSTGSSSTATSSSSTVGGQRVALLNVYSASGKAYAQTKVGDKVYTPVVGAVFAGSYKLLATSGNTATYLFGDEQFSLTEGQEVLK